jgi:uncharacterized protein (TIGR02145 family)
MNHKTFNSSKIWLTGVTLALLFTVFGCKKEDKGELATITTTAVTEVRATTASSGGLITANGGTTITARGVCWSTNPSPTVADGHSTEGNGMGGYSSQITGLSPTTSYFVRAYATNSAGTNYGNEFTFSTTDGLPTISTVTVTSARAITALVSVTLSINVSDPITARGVCWSTSPSPTVADSHTTDGSGTGTFTATATGLSPLTTYYARAYATNSYGTGYSAQLTFTTTSGLVSITTSYVSFLDATTVQGRGQITSDGGDPITERGICWGTSPMPTLADNQLVVGLGTGTFTANMTNFLPETEYYVRAYATNGLGTTYGPDVTFTSYGSVTDIDGNEYLVATIGNQKWMAQNLKTTHYRNGESIIYLSDNVEEWNNNVVGGYSWYNNNISNKDIYGALYNGHAVLNANGLCPTGWCVPTNDEFTQLADYLGGTSIAGGKLKKTTDWAYPNIGATNETGFSAVPGGVYWGNYFGINQFCWIWSSSVSTNNVSNLVYRYTSYEINTFINNEKSKFTGFSVRCLKDE